MVLEGKEIKKLFGQINGLIEENEREFKWNNYQFFIGENSEYSVLISMEKKVNPSNKAETKIIINSVTITHKNGQYQR